MTTKELKPRAFGIHLRRVIEIKNGVAEIEEIWVPKPNGPLLVYADNVMVVKQHIFEEGHGLKGDAE